MIDKLYLDALAPHIAREDRRVNGYQEGSLICSNCGANNASENRQRTAYVNSDNMDVLCPNCQKEADEYWDDMWSDFYSGCL